MSKYTKWLSKDFLQEEYVNKGKSPYQIAEENNSYANAVRRALIKFGFRLLNKSEAQKRALNAGRHKHPTKGTHRSTDTKIKIGQKLHEKYNQMSDEEKQRHSEVSKKTWENMDVISKQNMQRKAAVARRRTATEGSFLEKSLTTYLRLAGFDVVFHDKIHHQNSSIHTDISIKNYPIAIEVDGPTHFEDIFGQDRLNKVVLTDSKKDGLLVQAGYSVIRVRQRNKNLSETIIRLFSAQLIDKIQSIINDKTQPQVHYLDLE